MQHPDALIPDLVERGDVLLIALVVANLPRMPIVLELPVWRRGDDKVNLVVTYFGHLATVADD